MEDRKGVLCVGAIMEDVMLHVKRLPGRGEGVLASSRAQSLGGCAFNSGCAVRELGASCFLLAPLGTGPAADFIRAGLRERGLSALEVGGDVDCGVCTCMVEPDGERTMVTAPGIERRFEPSWFEGVDTSGYGALIASGYEIEGDGGDAIIDFAQAHPELVFYYGPGPRINGVGERKHARINALHPIWHLNELEALQFTGASSVDKAAFAIARACGNACVVTRSAKGSAVYTSDGGHIEASTTPVAVADTIGAGDAHVGALAAARAAGLDWGSALAIANAAAGVACTVAGGALPAGSLAEAGIAL